MYVNWQKVIWIPTSIFLIVLRQALGQGETQDYNNVIVDQHDYNNDLYDASAVAIRCYSCHYQVQKGHIQGHLNCNDPFINSGIPDIECMGPCGKIYHKLNDEDEFLITRACLPNCKEQTTEDMFTRCCTDDNCNSATKSNIHYLCISISLFVLYSIFS